MSMTPAPQQPAQPNGRVVTVIDGQGQNASGQWVKGRTVTYQLTSGQTGTVFVAGSEFSVEAVRAAIQADAAKLADVVNLTF